MRTISQNQLKTIAPGNDRVFVIGDIHGCLNELTVLLDYLNARVKLSKKDIIIFLGDYIDRGLDSKRVIDLLMQVKGHFPRTYFLKGNHEDMFIDFLNLEGGAKGNIYLDNGGLETLKSYGLENLEEVDKIPQLIPQTHIKFLQSLPLAIRIGDVLCVHAGLNPYREFEHQIEGELLWIRDEFILNPHPFGLVVIFGHTPQEDIYWDLPYKIGIDTGAVFGHLLTCLELQEGISYQVAFGTSKVVTRSIDR